jgi:hypothetical protein
VNLGSDRVERMLPLLAAVLVLPPWVWVAVRTKQSLEIITAHSIPHSKRTVWLVKILALIVGAGGVTGAAAQLGMPWFLAIALGALVVFFSLKESVEQIVPPKPSQDEATYQSSWQTYRRLRSDFARSCKWFAASSLALILVTIFADELSRPVLIGLFILCVPAVTYSIVAMTVKQLRWLRWPCPRCGCAFRGFWARPWLPGACVYCGLPRESDVSS